MTSAATDKQALDKLSIDARNQVLPGGLTASTTIVIDEKNDVLAVPVRAVRRS